MSWNFMDPASRGTVERVWRAEAEGLIALAEHAAWAGPTAAGHWEVRDVVGHMVDTTEGYFAAFDAARGKARTVGPLGLRDMAKLVDEGAREHRDTPREELIGRLRADLDRMLAVVGELTDEEWAGLTVPHRYMGPLPAAFYPVFQIVDYAIHAWDVREGLGRCHGLDGDAADLLVPVCFVLWQYTCDLTEVEPFTVAVRVTSGHNAGTTVAAVTADGMSFAPGEPGDAAGVIEFDPSSFVLTAFGRANAGTYRGDAALLDRFCNLFFRI